ncbi:MAG TPA: YdcH family protein [Dyella sp.]|uniref:YdcH family protein n=1 Tax=Dyella sp. TaxID=1869338 RepID=UPI002D78901F|nr:YdcH family protein [Dyella sp.]HET6554590.1 YdcH family protein [Dyella sp.]
MFPESRDLITELKARDPHFSRLFHRHNELDQEIKNMESGIAPAADMAIEQLKKEKLLLKDRLYVILTRASVS